MRVYLGSIVLSYVLGAFVLFGSDAVAVRSNLLCAEGILAPEELKAAPKLKTVAPLEGYYLVEGTLPDKTYASLVSLKKVNDRVYLVCWYTDVVVVGVGLLEGDHLVVGWTIDDKEEKHQARGVANMLIKDEKNLAGNWVIVPGDGNPERETWTFLAPPGKSKPRL